MRKILFWIVILILTLSWIDLEEEFTPKVNVYIIRAIFEEEHPFNWVLVLKDVETGEYLEYKTIGLIGDTLIRVRQMKTITEKFWKFEAEYKSDKWYKYNKGKLKSIREELGLD